MSSTNTDTVRTRILIISDTHTAPLTSDDREIPNADPIPPFQHPLPSADLAIHCGDLTHTGKLSEHLATIRMLSHIDAPVKLVIAGNHDLTLDPTYMLSHLSRSHYQPSDPMSREEAQKLVETSNSLWKSSEQAREAGVKFLDEGTYSIILPNGAVVRVHASPYTPEFCDWGFAYERSQDRFNPPGEALVDAETITESHVPTFGDHDSESIDILLTHGPPWGRLDLTVPRGDKAGCPHLLRALTRSKPLVHCFGHIHEGWGAERIRWKQTTSSLAQTSEKGQSSKYVTKQFTEDGGWEREYVESIHQVEVDLDEVTRRRGRFWDLSRQGGQGLQRGRETALVNAAIMDVDYRPVNGAWVLDLDLPKSQ